MLEILKSVLFGIVEGITEWMPVSSTGHMILLNEFVTLNVTEQFWEMFLVVIQLGAILAVMILYWDRIWPFTYGMNKQRKGRNRSGKAASHKTNGKILRPDVVGMWIKVVIACLPAVIIGLPFDHLFEELFYNYKTVSIMLIVVGIAFLLVETMRKGKRPKVKSIAQLPLKTAFIIGIFQLIAGVFPGTSRSGSTIIGALIFGVSRKTATEFTFFLSIPVMFGASLLKVVKFFASGMMVSSLEWGILGAGCLVAFLVSIVVIRFLMEFIKKHDFKVFGVYRIILGIIVLLYFSIQ